MSGSRQKVVVSRDYQPASDDCARALLLLLERTVIKKTVEPAPEPDGRDGTTVKEYSADAPIIRQ